MCFEDKSVGDVTGRGLWVTGEAWLTDFAVAGCDCCSTNLDILEAPDISVPWSSSSSVPEGLKHLIVCVE